MLNSQPYLMACLCQQGSLDLLARPGCERTDGRSGGLSACLMGLRCWHGQTPHQASPGEYVIQLDRKAGGRLGIDVDHKATQIE